MQVQRDWPVAVLMGGLSSERGVSLESGAAVLGALERKGWDVVGIDVGPDLPAQLVASGARAVWIALHGAFGEDGCVQGLLEVMRIPYTGSGPKESAVAMDKVTTKRLLADTDIAMPADAVWRRGDGLPHIGLPVVAKTPCGGSTLGIAMVDDEAGLERALVELGELDDTVLLEQRIAGDEITVAVLDGRALPVVAIVPESGFFDFEAKYTKGATRYVVPAMLPEDTARLARAGAVTAYQTLGLSGIARADFIVDAQGVPWFLEINTIPGMTATSLSPMAAQAVGVDFDSLVDGLLLRARLHLAPHDG